MAIACGTDFSEHSREAVAAAAVLARRLEALAPAEAVERGIDTEVEIVADDDVAEAIFETAERLEVDATCLSSHGRSGISKAIAGSVSQRVLTESRRPLFVIRPPRARVSRARVRAPGQLRRAVSPALPPLRSARRGS